MRGFKVGSCAAALVIALAVAGCGSDDDGSSGDASTDITKEEFVTQANAICKSSNEAIEAASEEAFSSGKQPTQAEAEEFITATVIPEVEGQLDGIRELDIPEGEEDAVNEILDAADAGVEEVKADPISATTEESDPFGEANQLSDAYGMKECAS